MADVINLGGSGEYAAGGSLVKSLLPALALGALVVGAIVVLPKLLTGLSSVGSGSGGTASGSTTSSSDGGVLGGIINSLAGFAAQAQADVAAGTQNLAEEITTPGEYVNEGTTTTPATGTGLGDLFVNTGPTSSNNLFPLGDVIDSSTNLDATEQEEDLANLCSNDIPSAWWETTGVCSVL